MHHQDFFLCHFLEGDCICCYIIKVLLCLPCPPLQEYLMFLMYSMCLISSMETILYIYTTALCYNGRSSHLVYRNLILSQAHLGKAQTIYPFIQLQSEAEQIAGKTTELMLDHWLYHDSKKVTMTLPQALSKALWNNWTVQKGITNHYKLLGSANTHTVKYEWVWA